MRSIRMITAVLITVLLTSCDDNIVMNIIPIANGYLWMAVNFDKEPPGHTFYSGVAKYDLSSQSWLTFYDTPFVRGKTYDMACGNGRAWVFGGYWDSQDEWYNYKIWEIGSDYSEAFWGGGEGLTFDGEFLWGVSGDIYGNNEFVKINPDTHESTVAFEYTDPRKGLATGLAWGNGTLWVVLSKWSGYGTNNEFIQFDPDTGEVLDSFGCIAKEPRGLAWDGEALWTSDYDSQCLYRIDPKTREVLGTFNPAPVSEQNWDESLFIWGLAFGDGPPDPQ